MKWKLLLNDQACINIIQILKIYANIVLPSFCTNFLKPYKDFGTTATSLNLSFMLTIDCYPTWLLPSLLLTPCCMEENTDFHLIENVMYFHWYHTGNYFYDISRVLQKKKKKRRGRQWSVTWFCMSILTIWFFDIDFYFFMFNTISLT